MNIKNKIEVRTGKPTGFTPLRTLYGHSNLVCRMSWTLDGSRLVSAAADGSIRVWDWDLGDECFSLRRHNGKVFAFALAPDGRSLVSGTEAGTLKRWDLLSKEELITLRKHGDSILGVTITKDGKHIISASADHTLKMFSFDSGEELHTFRGHNGEINAIITTPNDQSVISASDDNNLKMWDIPTRKLIRTFEGHTKAVVDVVISQDGRNLFSASSDASIKVWDAYSGRLIRTLEGHTKKVNALALSPNGQFLASMSLDNTIRLWDCENWATSAILKEDVLEWWQRGLAFHPSAPLLVTLLEDGCAIRVWELDFNQLHQLSLSTSRKARQEGKVQAQYANAKVVLVGDSGVGKSGLSLVLTDQRFEPTDSTHGRRVWMFNQDKVIDKRSGLEETRETLLWDLAGQPGYRVFHRQHLDEVAVALVLFDSRSEIDPFSGVSFWARALDEATRGFPLVKFLIAARIDRSGPATSYGRIKDICERYGFAGYMETSARRGDGVFELKSAIQDAIPWDYLPRVNTPELFADMKSFIVGEKEQGRTLQRRSELLARYRTYQGEDTTKQKSRILKKQDIAQDIFKVCLSRIEAAGLVKRLSFGDLVVLQPELLDDYTAWLAQAAHSEPDGLGHIAERTARGGNFNMDNDRPLKGQAEESLLITATIEDIVGRGIALRQSTEDGEMLVFPSELREDMPDYPGEYVRAVAFNFEGPLKAIHSTLAVRLFHAVAFSQPVARPLFYKNAALFKSAAGETCGFSTDYPNPEKHTFGRITVFFGENVSKNTKLTFLRYVNKHLEDMAYGGSIQRERIFVCNCGYQFPQSAIGWCRNKGNKTITCPIGHQTYLDDLAEQVEDWDAMVDELRLESAESIERDERLTVLNDREHWNEHDIFLCHDHNDKPSVRKLSTKLREHGILPWLDEEEIRAGDNFIRKLEEVIERIPVVAVIFGSHWPTRKIQEEYERYLQKDKRSRGDFYNWQQLEYYAFLNQYMTPSNYKRRRQLRMIPILLPGTPSKLDLPVFLRGVNWVDFRSNGFDDKREFRQLVQAILGERDL
jgi:GTPase SAR1 family protein